MSTDALWQDPLWAALENAIRALEDNHRVLHDLKPEAQEGLNIEAVNRLATGAGFGSLIEKREIREPDLGSPGSELVVERSLRFREPGGAPGVEVVTWRRGIAIPPMPVGRVLAVLRAWRDARRDQLEPSGELWQEAIDGLPETQRLAFLQYQSALSEDRTLEQRPDGAVWRYLNERIPNMPKEATWKQQLSRARKTLGQPLRTRGRKAPSRSIERKRDTD